MKTKKILAIVTLVAFMISILPMAAFAAIGTASQYGSKVYVVESEATADGDDSIEFDIYVGTDSGAPIQDDVYIVTNRSTTDVVYLEDVTTALTATDGVYKLPAASVGADGWATLQIRSKLAGNIKYAVGVGTTASTGLANYLDGTSASTVSNSGVVANDSGAYITSATFKASDNYSISFNNPAATFANGTSYIEVEATVTSNNTPVSGLDVDFSLNKSGATLNKDRATTNSRGQAKIKVFATKPGTYVLTAEAGDVEADKNVTFNPISVSDVKAESDLDKKVALDESDVTLKYSFNDPNGNKIKHLTGDGTITTISDLIASGEFKTTAFNYKLDSAPSTTVSGSAIIGGAEFRTISKPSGAKLNDKIDNADIKSIAQKNGVLEIKLDKSRFNKEGNYEIRLSLVNGKSVTYNISVKEQGDIVSMKLSYDAASISSVNGQTDSASVKLLDAEGYESDPVQSNLKFTVDNASLVSINSTNGVVTALDEGTGVVNVTAIESKHNMVATATVTLVKAPSALTVTAPNYNVVGEDATVTVQMVDVDGKKVSLGNDPTIANVESSIIVLSKPDGAIVNSDDTNPTSEITEDGKYTMNVTSNKEGAVKVQVVLTYDYTVNSVVKSKTLSGSATVNFGAVAGGKKDLVMFIGSTNYMVGGVPAVTDAAPFIQNGRTYVAVRPIGDALGCTINWDQSTQTVTMTKPGETVTIVIGASTIKVDRAGVVTEYPTDAPAQIKDGRTYLPFRAIGEAMGYTVNYDATTQAVTFTQA